MYSVPRLKRNGDRIDCPREKKPRGVDNRFDLPCRVIDCSSLYNSLADIPAVWDPATAKRISIPSTSSQTIYFYTIYFRLTKSSFFTQRSHRQFFMSRNT